MNKLDAMNEDFINRISKINPNYDLDLISFAFKIAYTHHVGQLRRSGDPYIIHPLEVAIILAELGMDEETIVAGIMHDVVEDTDYSEKQLKEDFGENIELLVNGVTKLGSLVFDTKEERQAENLRKMFLAMSKDIRVLIIKLADRLHNLRTINYLNEEKIKEKCKETLDIYAPLASRLGMYSLKFELEDIALKQLEPDTYSEISKEIEQKKEERQENLDSIVLEMEEALSEHQIQYDITGRSKHFYSIYKKKTYQGKDIDEIFDLLGIRVIVDSVKDCYAVLGIVHIKWTPIPGRFKDYIAMPKQNMYQSLHTTVIGSNGKPFEIQIRTYEMHRVAEYGIAAHWKYKEGKSSPNDEEAKFAWLRQSLEWQKEMDDPNEFMEALKIDLFENQVFVFTPKGDVMELPAGSTPLDFAFKVHTDVGVKCVGAKINGRMVPIDHTLKNGDIIEIVTNPNSGGPSIDWLKIAKSSSARSKIRQYLKKENKTDNIARGKDAIDKFIRRKGIDPKEVLKGNYLHKIVKEQGFSSTDELYLNLGATKPFVSKIGNSLIKIYTDDVKTQEEKDENIIENLKEERKIQSRPWKNDRGVIVPGMENLLIRVSKCCSPVPGDEIIGFITKGRGIAVHRVDCENIKNLPIEEKKRMIEVEWEKTQGASYDVNINIISEDRKGLFGEISRACESLDVNIDGVMARKNKHDATVNINLTLSIENQEEVNKVIRVVKNIPGIIEVYRAKG